MGIDSELMNCVGDLIDPSYKLESNVSYVRIPPQISHFSEYNPKSTKLSEDLIKGFDKHIHKPTPEEYEQYAIKRAKEEAELRIRIEESRSRGPAFLSDEWYANLPDDVVYARSGYGRR